MSRKNQNMNKTCNAYKKSIIKISNSDKQYLKFSYNIENLNLNEITLDNSAPKRNQILQ